MTSEQGDVLKTYILKWTCMYRCDPPFSLKLHGAETWDRDTIHPVTSHCTINMTLKLILSGEKVILCWFGILWKVIPIIESVVMLTSCHSVSNWMSFPTCSWLLCSFTLNAYVEVTPGVFTLLLLARPNMHLLVTQRCGCAWFTSLMQFSVFGISRLQSDQVWTINHSMKWLLISDFKVCFVSLAVWHRTLTSNPEWQKCKQLIRIQAATSRVKHSTENNSLWNQAKLHCLLHDFTSDCFEQDDWYRFHVESHVLTLYSNTCRYVDVVWTQESNLITLNY